MNNAHLARAVSRLHNGTTNEVARAQAEATLALAYEQRTANLINYMFHADGDDYNNIEAEIRERLGF